MKRAFLFGAVALASIGGAIAANATTITFDSFGGASPLYSVPPGETLYTDFSSGNPGTGTGTLYIPSGQSQSGDQPGSFVAAPYTATGSATGQFFATTPGETETFAFATDVKDVGVYIGSLDAENLLTIHTTSGDITYTGTQLASVPGASLPGDGAPTITGSTSNGRFTFVDSAVDITGISVSESLGVASNSFEIAQITTSVPEPSTWAMMGLGFAGLAFAGYRDPSRTSPRGSLGIARSAGATNRNAWTGCWRRATGAAAYRPAVPKPRCKIGVSTQHPCLKPTDRNVPTSSKPKRRWSAIEAELPLSPTIATIWRQDPRSQRTIRSPSRAEPMPCPPKPSAT